MIQTEPKLHSRSAPHIVCRYFYKLNLYQSNNQDLLAKPCSLTEAWPESRGDTPVARQIPSKLLSNTSFLSITPAPLLVTSIPAALPPKIRLLRSTGWLPELMSTPEGSEIRKENEREGDGGTRQPSQEASTTHHTIVFLSPTQWKDSKFGMPVLLVWCLLHKLTYFHLLNTNFLHAQIINWYVPCALYCRCIHAHTWQQLKH